MLNVLKLKILGNQNLWKIIEVKQKSIEVNQDHTQSYGSYSVTCVKSIDISHGVEQSCWYHSWSQNKLLKSFIVKKN